ncbi:MAG: hypothetical protein RhofKO_10570 [Rhodothermales bacterium]
MARCDKIEAKAERAANSLSFDDLCYLAECYGFVLRRQSGSHRIYKKAGHPVLSLQPRKDGKAKAYQVRQVLENRNSRS